MQTTENQETAPERMSGARILIEALHAEGVEYVFGYPGGAVLPIYDEIYKQKYFRHVLVRHEQAAVHAADAYSRCTDKIGVALVTSGPGATNAVTGIATAYADSIPMVVFSGQVGTGLIGTDAFQECDTVGITRPCVKHNFLVKDVAELAETIKKAFYIARTGRPGPVLVDLPKDVQCAVTEFKYPETCDIASYRPVTRGHSGQIKKAMQVLLSAKRPLLYVGGGATGTKASELVNRFVQLTGYPVVSTLMGLGAFDGCSDKFLGMVGMHGTYEANMAMQYCDVLFAVGARFDDRVIGCPKDFECQRHTIVQIDIDPSSISKNVTTDVPIVGDVYEVLKEMVQILETSTERLAEEDLAAWDERIAGWKAMQCLRYNADETQPIRPQAVIERVWAATKGKAIYATDVGEHQMWAAQYLRLSEPRKWLTSGGLGTMGYGFPAAVGASFAHPDKDVVCFTGDGSIQMNIQELGTVKQYGVKPKIFLLNNAYLGMVAVWQRAYYNGHMSESVMEVQPDFVKLCESYGLIGLRATNYEELDRCIEEAFGKYKDEFVFVDVHIAREEPVRPMVGPGQGLTDMVLSEEK